MGQIRPTTKHKLNPTKLKPNPNPRNRLAHSFAHSLTHSLLRFNNLPSSSLIRINTTSSLIILITFPSLLSSFLFLLFCWQWLKQFCTRGRCCICSCILAVLFYYLCPSPILYILRLYFVFTLFSFCLCLDSWFAILYSLFCLDSRFYHG